MEANVLTYSMSISHARQSSPLFRCASWSRSPTYTHLIPCLESPPAAPTSILPSLPGPLDPHILPNALLTTPACMLSPVPS